jgi:hypothetical protein
MTQGQTLAEQLAQAGDKAKTAEERCDAEHIALETATHELMKERLRFEDFQSRVAELVRQLLAQTTKGKLVGRSTVEDLERRLLEQLRLLKESEHEREHLRSETTIARQDEHDLRAAMLEIARRVNAAAQDFKAENARLRAALDHANGDRARLAYELANMTPRVKDSQAA